MKTSEAIKQRISTRAFTAQTVPETDVRDLLDIARFAPSGGNLQPWKVIAVAGAARDAVVELAMTNLPGNAGERFVYPPQLWEPYRSRRYKLGEDMYALLGIPRENKAARLQHLARNFSFFGAPVGLFFIIDTRMGYGQWAHLGMFMQSLALAACERGLASCMQEAWAMMRAPLHAHFGLPENEMIYCGMALGYSDESAPVNKLRSEREPVDGFARFFGF